MAKTLFFIAFLLGVVIGNLTCTSKSSVDVSVDPGRGNSETATQPKIDLAPAERKGDHLLLTGDAADLTVTAPGASRAELYYMPVTSSDRALRLKTIENAGDGNFNFQLSLPQDVNGEIWARVHYPNGEPRETDRLQVARKEPEKPNRPDQSARPEPEPDRGEAQGDQGAAPTTTDDNESAREDRSTGGKIQRAPLKRGAGNIRITVNVPAFLMTLWQDGKAVETYYVGVGRKRFPIPSGLRTADEIILNPDWIPPDSEWVRQSEHEPYERIPASDPDNPLGKIKVPLGDAYLLHEAQGPSDIGNLVSHGCVRVLRDDIFDLTVKIAEARGLSISASEIEAARRNSIRRPIDLNGELEVDINYDTMVVENGELQIFPDVYENGMNTVDKLKQELESYGLDASQLPGEKLEEMLAKVDKETKFVIPLKSLRSGRFEDGKTKPLIPDKA